MHYTRGKHVDRTVEDRLADLERAFDLFKQELAVGTAARLSRVEELEARMDRMMFTAQRFTAQRMDT